MSFCHEIKHDGITSLRGIHVHLFAESSAIASWLCRSRLVKLTMQCTHDGEAYVRASAIAALEQLVFVPELKLTDVSFAFFLAVSIFEKTIIKFFHQDNLV